ncbi:hypothetical protein ACOMHN_007940 [Nucella lapillus]
MHGPGKDIGPNETRLNGDTSSCGSRNDQHSLSSSSIEGASRQGALNGWIRHPGLRFREVFDESTTIPDAGGQRSAASARPQAHNGTDFYKWEANRLNTFSDWRYQSLVRKEDLARNGFIYTGTADKVRCVFCNIMLLRWDPGDVVQQEHRKANAYCPLLRGDHSAGNVPLHHTPALNGHQQGGAPTEGSPRLHVAGPSSMGKTCGGGDIQVERQGHGAAAQPSGGSHPLGGASQSAQGGGHPLGAGSGHHDYSSAPSNPAMAVEPERLATFRFWPPQLTQRPEELARCGLYYTGDGDRVRCFHCDVLLYNWEPGDDPYREHARWYPDCQYLQLLKGPTSVEGVGSHRPTQDEAMETPAVQALLFEGYSRQIIQKTIAALRDRNVDDAQMSAELLLKTVLDQEQTAEGYHSQSASQGQSEDVQSLQRENESLREKQQCKICMEREVEVLFYPCRHFVCCAPCAAGVSTCPICREPIHSRDKVFMS